MDPDELIRVLRALRKLGPVKTLPGSEADLEAEIPNWRDSIEPVAITEGENAILVCLPFVAGMTLTKPDNLTGPCAWCGKTIQFRPYAPETMTKVCIHCAAERPEKDQ